MILRLIPVLIALVWAGLDQALKAHVVGLHDQHVLERFASYDIDAGTLHVIPGFLSLGYDINKGAAWSLFSSATPFLVILRFVAGLVMLWYVWKNFERLPFLQSMAIGLIAGGAIGNATDGLLRGHVVDMLLSHWLTAIYRLLPGTGGAPFPIFNLADTGVVSGVILLAISSFFAPSAQPQPSAK